MDAQTEHASHINVIQMLIAVQMHGKAHLHAVIHQEGIARLNRTAEFIPV